ncbi:MAG TPA: translation elongation factor Ts [Bacilli bacterium]|jgi:elongation factor Ts|nr:elongation factor Ts [Bacilli bacterium]NLT01638.1 elongation factor Ts [Acholeplasmataceae bacterium]HNZ77767.1 translation elongation factor Ts [Bacilli bacterium]HOD61368.1 translation elongation factor Ts [Bacilli bacterium]HOH61147.1 translation elongation factor Ts [Bacilli bacterium]
MISAALVKELREITGAGMMDCKRALVETKGNMEEAVTWLREKGIMKAAKKESRIAAEGVCAYAIAGNKAVVYEVNAETDFVAKNQKFLDLVSEIGNAILKSDAKNDEEALEAKTAEGTVKDLVIAATATIGEKISLRRINVFTKTDNQVFGAYSHMGGKIVALSVLDGNNAEVAKDVCMHVAAMSPKYLDRSKVDADFLASETEILRQETLNEGKPENIVDKIVVGKVQKMLKTICLVDQMFVKNQDITVGQYVKDNKSNIVTYIRLEVGEGIEKRKDDFVAEVMAAVNN